MKSITELESVRNATLAKMATGKAGGSRLRVLVGMATCGIAAGARPVLNAIRDTLAAKGISDVSVVSTGCIGVCRLEPIVEVIDETGAKTTYVRMDAEKARRVVEEHLVGGRICLDCAIGSAEG
ncbi:MAG: (2Fe-2S) ferredoxin domain-containing protein [Clostridia bacterium]|nr:(2Fe-2S) ferredoxin domain-containing protein [Clostridia bacterium]